MSAAPNRRLQPYGPSVRREHDGVPARKALRSTLSLDSLIAFSTPDAVEGMNPMQPRCGARTRQGHPCRRAALRGRRRCRLHGGLSTGPRTAEGLARSRRARWKHGRYSAEAREARIRARMMQPSTEYERRTTIRRLAREDAREARRIDTAVRRVLGPA